MKKQYCSFFIQKHFFGLDVLKVREVIKSQEITFVPLADSNLEGLINLRGEIVTAIDLRKLLQLFDENSIESPMNIVVFTEDQPVSFLVDEVGDVIDIETDKIEKAPENMDPNILELIESVYKDDKQMMLILDISSATEATYK